MYVQVNDFQTDINSHNTNLGQLVSSVDRSEQFRYVAEISCIHGFEYAYAI